MRRRLRALLNLKEPVHALDTGKGRLMQQPASLSYRGLNITNILLLVTLTLGCLFHFLRIDSLPMGFYVDESSIGYNAHLIALTGSDEHGAHWPLYFQAFGEYKNPLYIYLLAGFYRVFGYSLWTTRAFSGCCWLVGSLCLFALTRRLFVDSGIRLYVALCLAFTPWLFSLTRVSYEFVILYPLLAFHLLALYRGFEEGSSRWALVAGLTIGLCLYAYTAFRLLALLYTVAVLLCYGSRSFRKAQIPFVLGAGISAIPFAIYALHHSCIPGQTGIFVIPRLPCSKEDLAFHRALCDLLQPPFSGAVRRFQPASSHWIRRGVFAHNGPVANRVGNRPGKAAVTVSRSICW